MCGINHNSTQPHVRKGRLKTSRYSETTALLSSKLSVVTSSNECTNTTLFMSPASRARASDKTHDQKSVKNPRFKCYPQACLIAVIEQCKSLNLTVCQSRTCLTKRQELKESVPSFEGPGLPKKWEIFEDWILMFLGCYSTYKDTRLTPNKELDQDILLSLPTYPADIHYPMQKWVPDIPVGWMCMNLPTIIATCHWARNVATEGCEIDAWTYDMAAVPQTCAMWLQRHAIFWAPEMNPWGICPSRPWALASAACSDHATASMYVMELVRTFQYPKKINLAFSYLGPTPTGTLASIETEGVVVENGSKTGSSLKVDGPHVACSETFCTLSDENNTRTVQAHKCEGSQDHVCDALVKFDLAQLDDLFDVDIGQSQSYRGVWSIPGDEKSLADFRPCLEATGHGGRPYIAISHVWSDGTGAGVQIPGEVNACLFQFFAKICNALGCSGIWWDIISLPSGREKRAKATSLMHENYECASCVVVHDSQLMATVWTDDGHPLLALALSAWFTRAWTAMELFAARKTRVKVLFSDVHGNPIIKDLDDDILSFIRRGKPRLAHYLSAQMITRCRYGSSQTLRQAQGEEEHTGAIARNKNFRVNSIQDLRTILIPRKTSWTRDRITIAALLCLEPQDIKPAWVTTDITQAILKRFRRIDLSDLVHSVAPMDTFGNWSWCPPDILELGSATYALRGPATTDDVCEVADDGTLEGNFQVALFESYDIIEPLDPYASASVKARIFGGLPHPSHCMLITQQRPSPPPAAQAFMLVSPTIVTEEMYNGRTHTIIRCFSWGWVKVKSVVMLQSKSAARSYHTFRERKPDRLYFYRCRLGGIAPEFLNASQVLKDNKRGAIMDDISGENWDPMYIGTGTTIACYSSFVNFINLMVVQSGLTDSTDGGNDEGGDGDGEEDGDDDSVSGGIAGVFGSLLGS